MYPLYFRIQEGKVHETRELSPGKVFADYDTEGNLLGLEILEFIPEVVCDTEYIDPRELKGWDKIVHDCNVALLRKEWNRPEDMP